MKNNGDNDNKYDINSINVNELAGNNNIDFKVKSRQDYKDDYRVDKARAFLLKYKSVLLLLGIIAFLIVLEFMAFGNDLSHILTFAFVQSTITKIIIIGLPYIVYLRNGMQKAELDSRYLKTKENIKEKQRQFESEHGYQALERFTEYRAEEMRINAIGERLRGSGITREEYIKKYEMLTKREIRKMHDLHKKQKKALYGIIKNPIVVKKTQVDDLMTFTSTGKRIKKNATISDGVVKFERKKAASKKSGIKLAKIVIFATFWAAMTVEVKQDPSLLEMLTWIFAHLFSVIYAMWSGNLEGIDLILVDELATLERKEIIFNRCEEWIKRGSPKNIKHSNDIAEID